MIAELSLAHNVTPWVRKFGFATSFPGFSLLLRSNKILTEKELERETKNKEDHFFEEKRGNFIAAVKNEKC